MTKTIHRTFLFRSSSGEKTYQTLIYTDGSTSCDCMGWTRRIQADGSRTCKHTRLVELNPQLAEREASCLYNATVRPRTQSKELTGARAFDFTND